MLNLYPYTDAHELNLDWILKKMKELYKEMTDFEALNTITYQGIWDITAQYPAWSIVNENNTGVGYISLQPVPAGIALTNTDYWLKIVDYSAFFDEIRERLDHIHDRYAVYIGNSFSAGEGSSSGSDGLFALTKDMFVDAWLFQDGARGLVDYDSFTTHNFLDLLNQAIASPIVPNDKITDVILIGAYGDVRAVNAGVSASEFRTNATAIVTNAKAAFPNLKKVSYTNAHAQYDFNARGYLYTFDVPWRTHFMLSKLLPVCGIQYNGWIGWNLMFRTSLFAADNIHPNDNGYDILKGLFINAYNGGKNDLIPFKTTTNLYLGGHICESYFAISPDEYIFSVGRIDRRIGGTPTQYDFISGSAVALEIGNPQIMYTIPPTSRSGEIAARLSFSDQSDSIMVIVQWSDTNRPGFYQICLNPLQTKTLAAYDLYATGLNVKVPIVF